MWKKWIPPLGISGVIILSVLLYVGGCPQVFGQDMAVKLSDFDRAASPEAHWMWSLLGSEAASTLLMWLLNIGGAALLSWLGVKGWRNAKTEYVVKFLSVAVQNTYTTYVRAIKAEGGKLTEAQKNEALKLAVDYAMALAKKEGVDMMKYVAKDSLPLLVNWIIAKMKRGDAPLV